MNSRTREQHESLKAAIQNIQTKPVNWHSGLAARKIEEAAFHNQSKRTRDDVAASDYATRHGNKKYYSTTGRSRDYLQRWLKERVVDKVFLDYACGNGERAIEAALMGAAISIGIDISDVSIDNAIAAAERAGVSDRCVFLVGDCENTQLPDNSVDVALCNGVLHHMDLSYAYFELRRILKPKGVMLAVEALNYNPVIKMYRRLTPEMRTRWEENHILSRKDLEFGARFFDVGEVRYWHLFSILATPFRRVPSVFNLVLPTFDALDAVLLRVPVVQLMGWQFTFELIKPDRD